MLKQMLCHIFHGRAHKQIEHMEPLIVKTMLQSKLESETSLPSEYLLVNLLLKSMTVDTTLKLT